MAKWTGWVAALGGLIALATPYVSQLEPLYGVQIGGLVAIIFGVWAAMQE